MASRTSSKAQTWSERGSAAIDAGDLAAAEQCFREAIRTDRRDGRHHVHLAIILEARAKFGDAAQELTQALRLEPDGCRCGTPSVLFDQSTIPSRRMFRSIAPG